VIYEAADLLYHMMVLLVHEEIALEEVLEELERRRRA
jgi:phosphoribosyl-ATP pyrophosphohydrolase